MPNTESAKRATRASEIRRVRNKSQRSTLKTMVKKVRTTAGTDLEASKTALGAVIKRLDKSAGKKLIHKNKAARLKSRLTKLVNKQTAAPAK